MSHAALRALVARTRPDNPLFVFDPAAARRRAQAVVSAFPGDVLYAVKCNPHPALLKALNDGGVNAFDVASMEEVRLVSRMLPGTGLHFMAPVKPASAIRESYRDHGVRTFAFDHPDELAKIAEATDGAKDCTLVARVAVPNGGEHDLAGKFGASPEEAGGMLRAVADLGARAGLTFHVGSQCADAKPFVRAVGIAAEAAERAGTGVALLDIGGGFPARYRGDEPEFATIAKAAAAAARRHRSLSGARLACEPGRLLAVESFTAVVRVDLAKPGRLHLSDGIYGGLSELKLMGPRFPVAVMRPDGVDPHAAPAAFRLFGPTCDSLDEMPGPFMLPADVETGDYLMIGMSGAYSICLSGGFNGFGAYEVATLEAAREPAEA